MGICFVFSFIGVSVDSQSQCTHIWTHSIIRMNEFLFFSFILFGLNVGGIN